MQILYQPNYYYNSITFGTTERRHTAGPDKEIVYNYSKVEREDLDFKDLSKFLAEHFKDKSKVDVFSVACSDGSEPYTLAMHLKELPINTDKFFPIKCSDNDGIIISCAQQNRLNMTEQDLKALEEHGIDYRKYFDVSSNKMFIPRDKLENFETYDVKDSLLGTVEFFKSTILQEISKMNTDIPKVLLCRNVLPYVGTTSEQLHYLEKICEKLVKNDVFVLGDYDRGATFIKALRSRNFEEVLKNVFVKIR